MLGRSSQPRGQAKNASTGVRDTGKETKTTRRQTSDSARGQKPRNRESSDESSEVDSDVERLVAETIDRRRSAVKIAQEAAMKAHTELEDSKKAHEEEVAQLIRTHQEALHRESQRADMEATRANEGDAKVTELLAKLSSAEAQLQKYEANASVAREDVAKLSSHMEDLRNQLIHHTRLADAKDEKIAMLESRLKQVRNRATSR